MKYSNYFRSKLLEKGVPEFDVKQFKRYVEIIDLEKQIRDLNPTDKEQKEKLEKLIALLTNNLSPEELYNEMISTSNINLRPVKSSSVAELKKDQANT